MSDDGRDLVWDAVYTASEDMTGRYGVTVQAARKRRPFTVTEGYAVPELDLFVAVRERSWFGTRWREVQSVADAASQVGARVRSG